MTKYWPEQHNSRKSLLASLALAAALLILHGSSVAQDPASESPGNSPSSTVSNDAAFKRVSGRLACQCSCPYLVSSCNMLECNSATYIRKTIQTQLATGMSEDAVVAGFLQQYGPRILAEPPQKGFWLTAWVMPFAILILGGTLVTYILWMWRSKSRLAAVAAASGEISIEPGLPPAAAAPSAALVEKYRGQIDRELENE